MRRNRLLLVLGLILLLVLVSCGKKECSTADDCIARPRITFTAQCIDNLCQYTPIPNTCGNGDCDGTENSCTCAEDCGTCNGGVAGAIDLVQGCVNDQCVETVGSQKPIYNSNEITSSGDKFGLDTIYDSPFSINKDTYGFTVILRHQGNANQNHKLLRAQLTGRTADGRTITLGSREIDKLLWSGGSVEEEIILDFPTVEKEAQISNLMLSVDYEYAVVQGTQITTRQATLKQTFKDKFTFVNPTAPRACPESCEDGNSGTEDKCGPETNYFCVHIPVPNTCGNFKCDTGETKCNCEKDCGPCSGSAGTYLDYTCKQDVCAAVIKPGVTVKPNSIFDEKNFGPVQLSNNYAFSNPFDVTKAKLELIFSIYQKDQSVSEVIIEKIRLVEGQQQIAEQTLNKILGEGENKVDLQIPELAMPEEERRPTLTVWYAYTKDGKTIKGSYQKSLGTITFMQPG